MFVIVDANNKLICTAKTLADAQAKRTDGTQIKLASDWKGR
jgi:hypothetical protein